MLSSITGKFGYDEEEVLVQQLEDIYEVLTFVTCSQLFNLYLMEGKKYFLFFTEAGEAV